VGELASRWRLPTSELLVKSELDKARGGGAKRDSAAHGSAGSGVVQNSAASMCSGGQSEKLSDE